MACGDESERKQSHPMVFLANEVLQTEIRVSVLGLQAKSHVEQYQTCIAGMLYFFFFYGNTSSLQVRSEKHVAYKHPQIHVSCN